ncbi:hypothetical protein CHUAL_008964 [Chamberlinius hualienensis]
MRTKSTILVLFICLFCLQIVFAYVEAVVGSYVPASHFQPQVAILCNGKLKFHNQYMDEAGRWVSDPEEKASCTKDKLEILEYCRKVYPKRDITNIVESSHYFRIENWCKIGGATKCKTTRMVKPYRCLEGLFQSDALLVPEHCLFDHIHNQSKCLDFDDWNLTASKSCTRRGMQLRSFAMLLPCGIAVFSGVEFVCCPHNKLGKEGGVPVPGKIESVPSPSLADQQRSSSNMATSENDAAVDFADDDDDKDDDDDDDVDDVAAVTTDEKDNSDVDIDGDSYEDDSDEEDDEIDENNKKNQLKEPGVNTPTTTSTATPTTITTTTSTTTKQFTSTEIPTATPDYYFSHYNPKMEHDEFKAAEKRLEDGHRDKVTKVMKDWSELEERYQEMKSVDPKGAESFKKKMTARFQKMVSALEDEGMAEKHQLVSLHQQRVMAHINEKKREAMECYTKSLNTNPPKAQRVQKCLEKLIRALEKDRTHTINHYKHLLNTNLEQASKEKVLTFDHLNDLSRTLNQSVTMLDHYPDLSKKIKSDILTFLEDLISHSEKTPYYLQSKEAENAMLEKYMADVAAKQEEHQRQKEIQKQHHQEVKAEQQEVKLEKQKVEQNLGAKLDRKFDSESMEDESILSQHVDHGSKVSHAQSHAVHHNEVSFAVKKEYIPKHKSSSVYVTLSFAGIALLTAVIVGVVFLRRRSSNWPANQGFVEVDQAATPEERHVANMQVNGYENPTYKYFDVRE